jgi:hypothetical protein
MSTTNNCTVTLRLPFPSASAARAFTHVLGRAGFSLEWDDLEFGLPPVDFKALPPGVTLLYARDVDISTQAELIPLARYHKLSIIVHAEWWSDCEGEIPSQIEAYDHIEDREISTPATNNSMQPLVELSEALNTPAPELRAKYGLPVDLEN